MNKYPQKNQKVYDRVIKDIKKELAKDGLLKKEKIVDIQKEIEATSSSSRKNAEKTIKGISKIFLFCLWTPSAFLLGIYLSSVTQESIQWEEIVRLIISLVEITVTLIGLFIMLSPTLCDLTNLFNNKARTANSYLQDIMYTLE